MPIFNISIFILHPLLFEEIVNTKKKKEKKRVYDMMWYTILYMMCLKFDTWKFHDTGYTYVMKSIYYTKYKLRCLLVQITQLLNIVLDAFCSG